ncbi:MAG: filamentous hemagglutinin, partial [Rivularia sp. (in: cyanobacteria)]
ALLDIGGSFLGSTAQSIVFEDGFNYSAIVSEQTPLLTVSVPLGLQMGQQSGAIKVEGTGHNLIGASPFSPLRRSQNNINLQVQPGKTLALVGGEISLNGAILTAESGNIELGSIGEGSVYLNQTNQGFTLDYGRVANFQDIQLSQQSLIDTSGENPGSIQVRGKNVNLNDGSKIWIQNRGLQESGNININASESLILNGTNLDESIASGLLTETLTEGRSGDITVSGTTLAIANGATIASSTYSDGKAGDFKIDFSESVELFGLSPITNRSSAINPTTYGAGNSGIINLSTKQLTILHGAVISSVTLGRGNAADVTINASESIKAIGISPLFQPSAISSATIGTGNAGNLTVNTGRLIVRDGGRIDSSTSISGAAGSVTVNASESVEVSGIAQVSRNPSLIISSANILDEAIRQRFGLPDKPFGASGNVEINTPQLNLNDGGLISVRNDGFGDGGTLQVNANSINLDNQGGITAATESGKGGNINLNLQDSLVMRRGSLINTESLGTGNGGNLTINSPIILGLENSDIIANAVEGNGGNINITTSGIFGLEFRDELTEESDITASSQFGVNGTVEINNIGIDPGSGIVSLPAELTDSSQQIAAGCSNNNGSSFVATGRGGIPQNPNEEVDVNRTWSDIRDLSAFRQQTNNISEVTPISNKPAIIEATGFMRNENGEIELVALENTPLKNKQVSQCSGKHT